MRSSSTSNAPPRSAPGGHKISWKVSAPFSRSAKPSSTGNNPPPALRVVNSQPCDLRAMRKSLLLLAGAFSVTCALAVEAAKPELGAWGVDLTAIDHSVKPGDDFFSYVNGNWVKKTEIPPERSSIGAFQLLRIQSEDRMKQIVADLHAKPAASLTTEEKKLLDLYDAFVDRKAIDAAGLAPAKADLALIARAKTLDDVARLMSSPRLNEASVFNMAIGTGVKDADKRAQAVYDVEAKIAQAHWTRAENRDEDKTYNPMSVSGLKSLAPDFHWDAFFAEAGVPMKGPKGERQVVVTQNTAFPALA